LKADEVVKILGAPAAQPPEPNNIAVQYLDEHVIVVEKPAGMTSNRHREERDWPARRRQIQPTLDELLPQVIAKIEGRKRGRGVPPPVRAVHRLDRETSGLIVFARAREAERHLAEQFRHHTAQRRYLAIVEGEVKAQTISTRLVRDRGDGRRGSTDQPDVGKLAVTHVQPLEYAATHLARGESPGKSGASKVEGRRQKTDLIGTSYTLIQCRLETGRTHQIRIHVSEIGHAVCGEKLYRQSRFSKATVDASGSPRLALHAAELAFVHPITGKPLRFQAALPKELAELWRMLKRESGAKRQADRRRSARDNGQPTTND
jgi:23S rRNA pseudouridine1911/1915/1917 synthase